MRARVLAYRYAVVVHRPPFPPLAAPRSRPARPAARARIGVRVPRGAHPSRPPRHFYFIPHHAPAAVLPASEWRGRGARALATHLPRTVWTRLATARL